MSAPRQQMYTSGGHDMQQPAAFPPGFGINSSYGSQMPQTQPKYYQAPPVQYFASHAAPSMMQLPAAVPSYHVPAVSLPVLTAHTNSMRFARRIAAHPYGTTGPQPQQQLQQQFRQDQLQQQQKLQSMMQQSMLQQLHPRLECPMSPAVNEFDGGDQPNMASSSGNAPQLPQIVLQLLQQPVQHTMLQLGGPPTQQQYATTMQQQQQQQQQQPQMVDTVNEPIDAMDQFVNVLISSPYLNENIDVDSNQGPGTPSNQLLPPSRGVPEGTIDILDLDDLNRRNRFNGPPPPAKNYYDSSPFFKEDSVESSFSKSLPPGSQWMPQNRFLFSQLPPQAHTTRCAAPAKPSRSPTAQTVRGFQSMLVRHADLAEQLETVIRRNDFDPRMAITRTIEALEELEAEEQAKRRSERENKRARVSSFSADEEEENEASSAGSSSDALWPPDHADPAVFKFPANDNGDGVEVDLSAAAVDFNRRTQRKGKRTLCEAFTQHVMRKIFENPRASARVTAGCEMRGSNKGYMLLPRSSIRILARFWIQYFKSPLLLAEIEDNMTNTIKSFLMFHRNELKKWK